ncbi:hypothetical protein CYY_003584 [Polysphondylium violaceum]|uniref:DNA repair protein rad9 n=1 Tax=Polysphondylium violaceum TaxID=133409 RepID=A0A8J4V5T5_9MYCE|nr:hypothetical protein CYY_003584 [Polysphondylium violaceum]
MKLVVAHRNIKNFAKGLQCISKIGDDLYIEGNEEEIRFTTVNNSKSTFVVFTFNKDFFETYEILDSSNVPYKVKSKLCFHMFKSLATIEKCALTADNEGNKISFYILGKTGIEKTYQINFECQRPLKALFNKDTPYRVIAKPKQMHGCLGYFANQLEEITLSLQKDRIVLKCYTDDAKKNKNKMLQTEISLDRKNFDEYFIDDNFQNVVTEMSFSYKDFKTIMSYCEAINVGSVGFLAEASGRPFVTTVRHGSTFSVDFVLATLGNNDELSQNDNHAQQQQSYQQQQQQYYQQQQYNQQQQDGGGGDNDFDFDDDDKPVDIDGNALRYIPSTQDQDMALNNHGGTANSHMVPSSANNLVYSSPQSDYSRQQQLQLQQQQQQGSQQYQQLRLSQLQQHSQDRFLSSHSRAGMDDYGISASNDSNYSGSSATRKSKIIYKGVNLDQDDDEEEADDDPQNQGFDDFNNNNNNNLNENNNHDNNNNINNFDDPLDFVQRPVPKFLLQIVNKDGSK